MCLTTKCYKSKAEAMKARRKPFIAHTDLLVYKVLRKDNTSPVMGTKYERNKLMTAKFKCSYGYSHNINVDNGLHAFTTKEQAKGQFNGRIIQMRVPKGSKYFVSGSGDQVVSNQLIW